MGLTPRYYPGATYHKSNVFYAPFLPYRTVYQHTTLQANDPVVHYTIGDLQDLERTNNVDFVAQNPPLDNIGRINGRYEPWTTTLQGRSTSPTRFDLSLKDPLVGQTDDFQFPTNKLPTLGWLGRVHRGTPWQTVYMKAPGVALDQWQKWTGNGLIVTNWDGKNSTNYDAELSLPYRDRYIFDLFTVALNDNATRGQMSVNQTSLAGWSAILSGVVAITNDIPDADLANNPFSKSSNTFQIIQPAGTYDVFDKTNYPPLARIVDSINRTRANTNLFPKQVFTHMGDILAVPELTIGAAFTRSTNYLGTYPNGHWTETSPYLNLGNPGTLKVKASNPQDMVTQQQLRAISDSDYERIPQQILSLLRLDQAPRFVVYAYGQALKPAEKSIITSGAYFGLCTNYQVTAEVATRAVIKIEGAPENPRVVVESFNTLPPD